jgi:3-dehydroquinate synthase
LLETRFEQPRREADVVVWRSITRMLDELSTNLFEDQSYKRLVDFGHTFSPSLEAETGFQLTHGEAVAIDMALSSVIACDMGLLSSTDRDRAISLLIEAGLPIHAEELTTDICRRALAEATSHRGGSPNLVIPGKLGHGVFVEGEEDLPNGLLEGAIHWLARRSEATTLVKMQPLASLAVDSERRVGLKARAVTA